MEIKETTIEKTIYETKKTYIANDGTEFKDMEECEKYEETAKCAINSMFRSLPMQITDCVGEMNYLERFGYENTMYAIKIDNADQLEVLNKWIKTEDANMSIGTEAIGTIQLISVDDMYSTGLCVEGTPEEVKEKFSEAIDKLYDTLIEKSEEEKGEK